MSPLCFQAEDDVIRSGILEITDKQSVVLLSAIAMAMDLQEDAAPTDKQTLAMEVREIEDCCKAILAVLGAGWRWQVVSRVFSTTCSTVSYCTWYTWCG